MQDNTLTLSVDAANDGNPANQVYSRYEEYQNRSVYVGATHVPDSRDMIAFYRTFPTKSGNFKGTSKSSVKLTEDISVTGADGVSSITAPLILEASFSVPVGATAAQIIELRQRLLAMLDNDTLMNSLNIQLMV